MSGSNIDGMREMKPIAKPRSFKALAEIVEMCEYKNWKFMMGVDGDKPWVQVVRVGPRGWKGRKWKLSYHMTNNEIVQTLLLAVKIAEEHEMRKRFKYQGVAIFGPHLDPDQLVTMMKEGKIGSVFRDEPPAYDEADDEDSHQLVGAGR